METGAECLEWEKRSLTLSWCVMTEKEKRLQLFGLLNNVKGESNLKCVLLSQMWSFMI